MPDKNQRHSVSVAAAIVDEQGRVLGIQRRDNGHWEPPGGVLELDETIEDGLRREVMEETGLSIEIEDLSGIYKNMNRGIVALVFKCRPTGAKPVHTAEAATFRWLEPHEIHDLVDEAYAVRLLDALADNGVAVRSHDGVHVLDISG
jgi:8-oxo-dGTP diphosphatase